MLEDIRRVGQATDRTSEAGALVDSLEARVSTVKETARLAQRRPRVACLEWLDPTYFAGHWVPQMVEVAGGEDCLAGQGEPSQRVDWATVVERQPEIILIIPCGFDIQRALKEVHLLTSRKCWNELPAARDQQVYVANASAYFSRSGPRLIHGLEIMAEILHPELFSGMVPQDGAMRIYGEVFKVS